jgi:subtilisin family serine protease
MKQYNVALKADIDYDGFWNDMESDTDGGKLYIPNRKVEFTNERPASLRQCWYLLTDEEAELLRQDDRVYCVEIPPEHRDDIVMMHRTTQTGDFTKTTSDSGAYLNWGLIRSSNSTNVYGTGTTTALNYNYTLDGTGVDVVIQDSGLQVDHPEFTDGSGTTRVQQIDWGTVSGLFTQNANHYRDYDGHGTHVAGIVAGKTYGWAKNARIYSLKVSGLEGSGDSGTGVSVTYCFDAIKIWHTSKGGARPTVVNMSWGYGTGYNTVTSLTYRGTTYSDASTTGNASYRYSNYGLNSSSGSPSSTYVANVRIGSVDVDIEELIAAGVIVCIAAGNRGTKIDISSGTDYNNYVTTDGGNIYYHRGSSPYSDNALMVGSIDSTAYDATNDQRATYSETGPGVSIWAPGTDIMSATSNTNRWGAGSQNYYLNSSYKQTNISGTSMAAPQVCGVAALVMQLNPSYTPAQLKASLLSTAGSPIYTTGLTNDYSNTRSLLGSSQKFLYRNYDLTTTTTTTTTTTAAPTTTTTTAAPTTTTTTAAPTTTTTTAAPTTTTTTTSTTTTTTTAAPVCNSYVCTPSKGGYLYWVDCQTGNQCSALINGGKSKHINSKTYPTYEMGARFSISIVR